MGWFESRETKERRSQFKNMISLALIDGEFDDAEREFLQNRGLQLGLSAADVKAVLEHPERVEFVVPKDPEHRIHHLYDLVFMMIVDGELRREEMDFVQTLAVGLGFRPSSVDQVLQEIVEGARRNCKPTIDAVEFLEV
ncbi:MAG: TerB family tellurite resistance protein [Verrucomicrobia bacterium]|nr:TerB family tellurite resistance protein [Verrucomicrobiota bacterium]